MAHHRQRAQAACVGLPGVQRLLLRPYLLRMLPLYYPG